MSDFDSRPFARRNKVQHGMSQAECLDGATTRQRILDAAARSFITHGYRDARLAQIARVAGVSRSTLYEYFPGKEQVLIALNHQLIEVLVAQVRDTLGQAPSALDGIRSWLRTGVQPEATHRPLLKIIYADDVQPSLLLDRDATRRSICDAQKWVRRVLRQGIRAGELRADLAVPRTAHSLQNLHSLLTRQAVADYPLFDFGADKGETTIDIVLRGLQSGPGES